MGVGIGVDVGVGEPVGLDVGVGEPVGLDVGVGVGVEVPHGKVGGHDFVPQLQLLLTVPSPAVPPP